jgi:hypothetical protein
VAMQINATFLIQIINFWVTYTILHRLLLRPLVHLINKKDAAKATMIEGIKQKEHVLARLQEDKHKNLEIFRNHVKTKYIFITPKPASMPPPSIFIKDPRQIALLTQAAEQLLIEKAPHAF